MASNLHLQYPPPLSCGNRVNFTSGSGFSSAIHILRTYNNLLIPTTDLNDNLIIENSPSRLSFPNLPPFDPATYYPRPPNSPKFFQIDNPAGIRPVTTFPQQTKRQQRGEKKPIPREQKDEKYFERRKRNNQAAKKSRDARKIREDQIALRATMLEHENAILRAQVLTLREEAAAIKRMFFLKKTAEELEQLQPPPK